MFFLAIRHLLFRKRQTVLTLLGILLGAGAYVTISGFMLGFRTYLIDQLVNNDAHIRVSAREVFLDERSFDPYLFRGVAHVFWAVPPSGREDNARIEDPEGWYRRLDADPRVQAYSPQLTAQVILTRAKATLAARLIGSDPERQEQVTTIQDYMTSGKFSDIAAGGNRVIAGEGVLKKIGARISESVLVSIGSGQSVPCKIIGSFNLGIRTVDDTTLFASLSDVQTINRTPSQVNEIAVRLKEVAEAADVATHWAETSSEKVQSWDQANANFLSVFRMQDIIRYMMIVTILVVAGFGIYNILNMVVSQKRREIAILRSMGYEPRDIVFLFFVQGALLGAIGGLLGIGVGYLVCRYIETLPAIGHMGGQGHMIVSFQPRIYVIGYVLALFASVVASVLPARAAGSLAPIDVIRGGGE